MIAAGDLLEHAEVYGHGYGTPRAAVEQALAAGRDVLFDIDWQGTQQLREVARDDMVSVFILPPSMAELERGCGGAPRMPKPWCSSASPRSPPTSPISPSTTTC